MFDLPRLRELHSQAMSIPIAVAIDEYIPWRKAQGFAKNTIRNDKSALKFIVDTLGPDFPVDQLDDNHVLQVLDKAAETRSASSINMVHASMSGFFKWCRLRRYMPLDHDPILGLRYRKVQKKERKRLGRTEIPVFMDCARDERDRAALALGMFLFLRSSEVASLRVRDLDLQQGTIGVTVHKTYDYDVMPLGKELDKELRRWLLYYQSQCGPLRPEWHLVPAKIQTGFHKHGLNPTAKISRPEDIVKITASRFGWEDTHWQGFHLLRASGARNWYDELVEQGEPDALKIVQAHLHHSSVTMTERYLGITGDRARRDKMLKGKAMFPSLEADNVIQLRKVEGE